MSTIGYQLNILRDTQMVQRRLLEKQFPYIDWARMPFSSYGDFFRLRGILDDCGAVWTNAYGRSNDEAESTRKYLKDYSGKGRDIELFNFGYSRQSGYNGYVQDFRNSGSTSIQGSITESKIDVTNIAESTSTTWIVWLTKSQYVNAAWKAYVEFDGRYANIVFLNTSDYHTVKSISLQNGKIAEIPALTEEELADYNQVAFAIPKGSHLTLTQIAPYQGAIVSDGVDDYGQCVKDFALPDDYTVVAMREFIQEGAKAALISKSHESGQGAFVFDNNGVYTYSYGTQNDGVPNPLLFSYQTKTSCNGTVLTAGTVTDTDEDKLNLFTVRLSNNSYAQAALYSVGIFTRTLTADELRIVENCMYAEWIAMTGKLEDIEYYDILDARFRSNEEDADKRNKWVGRLGKLHMTLNNYAYSQMSGWNGYPQAFHQTIEKVGTTIISKTEGSVTYRKESTSTSSIALAFPNYNTIAWKIKTSQRVTLYAWDSGQSKATYSQSIPANAWTEIPAINEPFTEVGLTGIVGQDITVEQPPLYGGALVSDGVDDNAISDEIIYEEIGGVVMMAEKISDPTTSYGNVFSSSLGLGGPVANRIAGLISKGSDTVVLGDPWTSLSKNDSATYGFARSPLAPNNKLMVGNNKVNEYGNAALYQLRLIKTQPTETQLEAIKWQCRKEHDDYLIHMGWKELE